MPATTSPTTALGQFVRHDLMSTDPGASESFFTSLFGWRVEHKTVMGMTIRILFAGDHRVGAIMPFAAGHSYPSHWVGYVADGDVAAIAKNAVALGGSVCIEPMTIPPLGHMVHVNDPDGALILPITPAYPAVPSPAGQVGTVCWNELIADDPQRAATFYGDLFGWQVGSTQDLGPAGCYTMMVKDGVDVAGILTRSPEMGPRATWLFYFLVADVAAAGARVTELGGKTLAGPMPIPGIGRFTICSDPTGADFALFERTTD